MGKQILSGAISVGNVRTRRMHSEAAVVNRKVIANFANVKSKELLKTIDLRPRFHARTGELRVFLPPRHRVCIVLPFYWNFPPLTVMDLNVMYKNKKAEANQCFGF